MSNAAGQLLFYSNGKQVMTAGNTVMPNGNGILGNYTFGTNPIGSATQGVAIVPAIGNNSLYYLFTLDPSEFASAGMQTYMRYSVIDMSLNGGMGDVVAGQKNIVIDSGMGEKMIAVRGAGCSVWVIAHKINAPEFHAFRVSATGVNTVPVVSVSGAPAAGGNPHAYYKMIATSNDSLLVNTCINGTELHDFNKSTGVISNARTILTGPGELNYGAAFSPDDKKLYLTRFGVRHGLAQYDLSLLPNMTAVNGSRILLDTLIDMYDARLGPDGKIYMMSGGGNINRINSPNLPGTACGYTLSALFLPSGTGITWGTPVVVAPPDSLSYHTFDTSVCFGPPITLSAPTGYTRYNWSDGKTTRSDTFSAASVKWSYSTRGCAMRIDTFRVRATSDTVFFSRDTTICLLTTSVTLQAPSGYASYRWSDGGTLSTNVFTTAGPKWVISRNSCHYRIDTFRILPKPFDTSFHSRDTSACFPVNVQLNALPNYTSYHWSNGSTAQSATFNTPGTQWVIAQSGCSLRMDTIRLAARRIDTTYKTTDTTVCFSPQVTVSATGGYNNYTWSDGSTTQIITFTAPGTRTVYMQNGCFARLETFQAALTDFTLSLGADTALCKGDTLHLDATTANAQYTWQDGSHGPVYAVTRPGHYTVTVRVGQCMKTDDRTITDKVLVTDLGGDRKLCNGDQVTLNAASNGASYIWQDGSIQATLPVTAPGTYWVSVSLGACRSADTAVITYHNCDCRLIVPNAFTPNNDSHNDVFRAKVYGEPDRYELKVFNRWGQCVFTTFDLRQGWDGTFNGNNCDLGTYYYQVKVRCFKGQEETTHGEVTLIR